MLLGYAVQQGRLVAVDDVRADPTRIVWFDLLSPTPDEEAFIERVLGLQVPNREEMEEIEVSSRLYVEDGGTFVTASIIANGDSDDVIVTPVTFVLAGPYLVTIRYEEPKPFRLFPQRAEKVNLGCTDADATLVALLDALVDRLADILERAGRDVDTLSRLVFGGPDAVRAQDQDFQGVLEQIGRKGTLASNIRDSLLTLQRAAAFLANAIGQRPTDKDTRTRVKTLARDIQSLLDHDAFLAQKIQFLLDATLGMINIEQNAIIKIFSIAAVVLGPPTLIASIFGMNFEHMPELRWLVGYPYALGLMVVSALVPLWFFRRKGWL